MASKVGVWVLQRTREQPTPAAGMAERIVSPRRRERKRRGEQQRHWELGALAPFRGGGARVSFGAGGAVLRSANIGGGKQEIYNNRSNEVLKIIVGNLKLLLSISYCWAA